MGRPKNIKTKLRVRLDGYLDEDDEILKWLLSLPPRSKFPSVIKRLKMGAALSTVSADTPDDEVLRLVREAEAAADAFFDKYEDDE